jgi:hypothetical protein
LRAFTGSNHYKKNRYGNTQFYSFRLVSCHHHSRPPITISLAVFSNQPQSFINPRSEVLPKKRYPRSLVWKKPHRLPIRSQNKPTCVTYNPLIRSCTGQSFSASVSLPTRRYFHLPLLRISRKVFAASGSGSPSLPL